MTQFSKIFTFKKKSHIKAGEGLVAGKYPFYTSSPELTKYINDYVYEGSCLIFGTGGLPSVHFESGRFATSTDCLVAQPVNRNDILPKYYYYFLKGNIHILERGFKGAGLQHISKSYISNITLPEANVEIQYKIIDILDQADAIRQKRKQSIQFLDDFLRATFFDMFGDPLSNSKGFAQKKIGEIGEVVTGNTPSRKKREHYGDFIEWIKSDNINTPQFILTKAKEYLSKLGAEAGRIAPKGSVLVSCIAGSPDCIGNVAMTDREVAFNQQINTFIPGKDISQKVFFTQILFWKELVQQASTNSMKGMVSKGKFLEIKVLVPPIEQQEKFDKVFDIVHKMRQKMQQSLSEMDSHFNALMQRYFE